MGQCLKKRPRLSPCNEVIHRRRLQFEFFASACGTRGVSVKIERGDFELPGVGALEAHYAGELSDPPRVGADVDDAFEGCAHRLGLMVGLTFLGHHLKQDAARCGQRLVVERHGDNVAQVEVAGDVEVSEVRRDRQFQVKELTTRSAGSFTSLETIHHTAESCAQI